MTPLVRRLAVALAVSLGLNLLCAGFGLGRLLRHGDRPRKHDATALSAPELRLHRHPALRAVLGERREELREQRKAVHDARVRVAESLRREPFDRAALEGSLAALRQQTSRSQELVHEALIVAAERGDAEARRALAAAFERPFKGERRR